MANLRGFSDSTGNRKKHRKKHTAAPTLHAMNISIRSHRLTGEILVRSAFAARGWTGFGATRALRVKHHQTQELNLCHLDRAVQRIDHPLGRLTGKETILLIPSICSGQRCSGRLMGGQLYITPTPERIQRLEPREKRGRRGAGVGWNIRVSSRPTQRVDRVAERGRGHVPDKARHVLIGGESTTLCLQTIPRPLE